MSQKLRLGLLLGLLAVTLAVAAIVIGPDWFAHDEPSYSTTNYSLIEDGLYLGGYLGEAPPGTRAVLNLCEKKDRYAAEVHCWQPIPDAAPAPSMDWLRQQVAFVDQQRRAGLPVFVHCAAGISRSAMVVAAYLMARDGCSRDQALARIRTRRPGIAPNPAFMRLLLDWEEALKTHAMLPPAERHAEYVACACRHITQERAACNATVQMSWESSSWASAGTA